MDKNRMSPENLKQELKPVETDSAEIVRRHLEDENHEISDEDIRNVKINLDIEEPVTTANAAKEEGENTTPEPDAKPGTPWDVLSED
jgi:hypothetical protein